MSFLFFPLAAAAMYTLTCMFCPPRPCTVLRFIQLHNPRGLHQDGKIREQ